jgi:chorismate mutase
MTTANLKDLRNSIDKIDKEILQKIEERGTLARAIFKIKAEQGLTNNFSPDREGEIFKNLFGKYSGKLEEKAMRRIFSEIISVCRSSIEPVRYTVLGSDKDWQQSAAIEKYGSSSKYSTVDNGEELLSRLEANPEELGIISTDCRDKNLILEAMLSERLHIIDNFSVLPEYSFVTNCEKEVSEIYEVCVTQSQLQRLRDFFITFSYDLKINICRSVSEIVETLHKPEPVAGLIPTNIAKNISELKIIKSGLRSVNPSPVNFLTIKAGKWSSFKAGQNACIICSLADSKTDLGETIEFLHQAKVKIFDLDHITFIDKPWQSLLSIYCKAPSDKSAFEVTLEKLAQRTGLAKCVGFFPENI